MKNVNEIKLSARGRELPQVVATLRAEIKTLETRNHLLKLRLESLNVAQVLERLDDIEAKLDLLAMRGEWET